MICPNFEENCELNCIIGLRSDLDQQYDPNKNATVVFLDIKKTYDNVLSLVGLRRLEELGVAGRPRAFIRDFLYNLRL